MAAYRGLGWRFRVLQLAVLVVVCIGFRLVPSDALIPSIAMTMRDRSDRLATAIALARHDGLRMIERPLERMMPVR